ncbi:MAG TPA: hypothetical protein VHY56_03945 [Candidatus Binataceae bacterium]|nr:hypothetical protein [Candidatus Binataceae bacterium]
MLPGARRHAEEDWNLAMSVTSSERLKGFFLSLVRQSFGQLGVSDPPITDYIATVLTDFSRSERWLALRGAEGRRLTSAVEMMLSQISPSDQTRALGERELRKHVGDYTLFMSGLFRRFVERGGYLDYYLEEGARSYREVSKLAASLDGSFSKPDHLMFEELSKGFEHYSGALDFMRKCYFAPAPGEDPFAGFYRQVHGWVRDGLSNN